MPADRTWLERFRRRRKSMLGAQRAVGGHWEEVGKIQFDYLVREGLLPGHKLLDVACGSFRVGRLLIPYLDTGHYIGIDRDAALMETGRENFLKTAGLLSKQPRLQQVEFRETASNLRPLLQEQFDYIWVHALFDHISPESIRFCLRDLATVLADSGKLYATIFLNPHGTEFREPIIHPRNGSLEGAVITYPDREYWHQTLDFFETISKEIPQLQLDACLYDYPHPLGLRMLRFIRRSS